MGKHLYIIYEHPDGRRARMLSGAAGTVLLTIRADRGQGACLLSRHYTTRAGARSALTRRGSGWYIMKQIKY